MQFTTALLTLTAAIATTVSATPTPSTTLSKRINCTPNDVDINVLGITFQRFSNIDFQGYDHQSTFGVKSLGDCAKKCVEWNKFNPYNKCVGVSYVPAGTSLQGRFEECWLKSNIPDCGKTQSFYVESAIIKC